VAVKPSADAAMPMVIDLPLGDMVEEPFLEVRLLPSGEVVTVIEFLSHTNKQGGRDRTNYEGSMRNCGVARRMNSASAMGNLLKQVKCRNFNVSYHVFRIRLGIHS